MVKNSESPESDVLAQIPGGLFILAAQYEGIRGAMLVKWMQQCSDAPPMVMVALPKGQPIEQLIHGSQCFTLCQISADDRFLLRKFQHSFLGNDDPLVSMMTTTAPSGSPIIDRAMNCMDCTIVRHVELDADYRIYVGQVQFSAVLNRGTPAVCFGGNGLANTTPQ